MKKLLVVSLFILLTFSCYTLLAQDDKVAKKQARQELREQKRQQQELRKEEKAAQKQQEREEKNKEKELRKAEQSAQAQTREIQKQQQQEIKKKEQETRKAEQITRKQEKRDNREQEKNGRNSYNNSPQLRSINQRATYNSETHKITNSTINNQKGDSDSKETSKYESLQIQNSKTYSTQENSDGNKTTLIIFVIVIAVIYSFISWFFSGRCRQCGKLRAMIEVDEKDLGIVKSEPKKDVNGVRYMVYHHRIQVLRRCKYCGHEDTKQRIEKNE